MKWSASGLAVLALALGMRGTSLQAQSVNLGLAGGATAPSGDLNSDMKLGWHAQAMLGISLPVSPVSFRLDGIYHRLSPKGNYVGGSDARIWAGALNAIVRLPTPMVSPYLIGGGGYYNLKSYADGSPSVSKFGWDAGAGVGLPLSRSVSTFVEAQYISVLTDGQHTNFVPVTLGVTFH